MTDHRLVKEKSKTKCSENFECVKANYHNDIESFLYLYVNLKTKDKKCTRQ